MTKRQFLAGCALAQVLCAAQPVHAQDAADVKGVSEASAANTIIVTATRRDENLQDVPIAISAFSAETLDQQRIESVADVDIGTPGLNMASAGVGVTPFIRGVGQPTSTPGGESPIAMYVDGVYQPTIQSNDIPFNNVERIEVLKGPQGTLFGRNATGGLIHVITKDPTEEFGGDVSVSYANYQTLEAKAYLTGGLADGIAMDLAAYYRNRDDGWGVNYDGPLGRFGDAGSKIGPSEDLALRSKLLAHLGDRLTVTVIGDYRDLGTSQGYNYRNVPGTIGQDGLPPVPGYYNVVVTPGRAMHMDIRTWGVSGKIAYEFDGFTVTSLTAYNKVKIEQIFDNDLITADLISATVNAGINDTFQQEVQIASNGDGPLTWIAGFYYLDMEGGFGGQRGIQLTGAGLGVTAPIAIDIRNTIKTTSKAVFAEVTYDLTDRTSLTLGGRYTWDKRRLVGETILDGEFGGYAPIVVLSVNDTAPKKYSDPTYRAILNHDFSDALMVYASYSHGFKSGSFNVVDATNPPYDPEELDAYEIGAKFASVDGSFTLNAAAYYYDYSNLQFEINTGISTQTQNAASARIKGFELDATIRPVSNLTLNLGYAYVDGEYRDFTTASFYDPNPAFPADPTQTVNVPVTGADVSGTALIRTPKHAINASLNYKIPIGTNDLDIALAYRTTSDIRYDLQGRLVQKPFDLVNGSVFFDMDNGLKIGVFGKNLLNEKYSNYYIEQAFGDYYTAAPPRTYGIEVGFSW